MVRRLALLAVLMASTAFGATQRFALVVGNNRGQGPDVQLRYAESDAARFAKVLRDIGDFEPADVVLLQGETADTTRRTLISLNDRIRTAQSLPNTDTLLFVYYSGHADGQSLHLGDSKLQFRELAQLVRGSSATFRLLVVDACRSGTLTRAKGGRIVAPFGLADTGLNGEGLAFLTASAENEDAQESDELRGSFFTHSLVSGLLGAADRNHDGAVVLEEAYAYAHEATIRGTSKTFAGTQHPMFQYEVKGQGSLVLTRPRQGRSARAWLVFPRGMGFLVFAGDDRGAVIGELGQNDASRGISLAPGKYFVRGRAADFLLEGAIQLEAGRETKLELSQLSRVEYARLVRKGQNLRPFAQAVEGGATGRLGLGSAVNDCLGVMAAFRLDFSSFGLRARADYCSSSFRNLTLVEHAQEGSLSIDIERVWDTGRFSVFGGLGLGTTLLHQSFETRGVAPARLSSSPMGLAVVGAEMPVWRQLYLGLDVRLEESLVKYQDSAFEEPRLRAVTAGRLAVFTGLHL